MPIKPPPPRQFPVIIIKEKEAYQYWLTIHRNFPRVERLGIGQKIENLFLDVLELSFSCVYMPPESKPVALNRLASKIDALKFFSQLAWESRLVPTDKYTGFSERLEEIGRMLGGWRKGLQSKSTPSKTLTTP